MSTASRLSLPGGETTPIAVGMLQRRVIAYAKFEDALQEIFTLQAPPRRRPDVLNDDPTRLADSVVPPGASLAEVAAPSRRLAREPVA